MNNNFDNTHIVSKCRTAVTAILLVFGLNACGGGSSSPAAGEDAISLDPIDDDEQGLIVRPDGDTTEIAGPDIVVPDGTESIPTDTDTDMDMDTDTDTDTVNESELNPEVDEAPVTGTETASPSTTGFDAAFFIASEDGPAPGAEGILRDILTDSVDVSKTGNVMFLGNINDRETSGLWGGPMSQPSLVLQTGMQVTEFPPNIRLQTFNFRSSQLQDNGDIATIVTMGGARSVNAVLLSTSEGVKPVVRSDQPISVSGQSMTFSAFSQVEHNNGTVAFIGNTASRNLELVLARDSTYELIAPSGSNSNAERIELAPLQPDGCRILLRSASSSDEQQFHVLGDGSLVFEAKVNVEAGAQANVAVCPDRLRVVSTGINGDELVGSGFPSIVIYRGGDFNRIVSKGDPVPGMEGVVFNDLFLQRVLEDGSLLVSAEISDSTQRNSVLRSRWIFREGSTPSLVALNGEQTVSAITGTQYEVNLGNSNGFGGASQVDVLADGSALLLDAIEVGRDEFITWLISGNAHTSQPHTSFSTIGASSLSPVLVTGTPAPDGFADSTFWSSIRWARRLPSGGGIFSASIVDSAPGVSNPVGNGIWFYDNEGNISKLMDSTVTINIGEIPRTIDVPLSSAPLLIGDEGIVFVENGRNSLPRRIVYLPLGL